MKQSVAGFDVGFGGDNSALCLAEYDPATKQTHVREIIVSRGHNVGRSQTLEMLQRLKEHPEKLAEFLGMKLLPWQIEVLKAAADSCPCCGN